MNAFVNALATKTVPESFTDNGAVTYVSSNDRCVDLFSGIGSQFRGNIVEVFENAFYENPDLAIRILLWSRDVRGGAGRRDNFFKIVRKLEVINPELAYRVMLRLPELGRWKDLLEFSVLRPQAIEIIATALNNDSALCAKWMPRKGEFANELRRAMGLSPKAYRKLVVGLTKVVETQMCAKQWDKINYNHVPSVANLKYRKAFSRNDGTRYAQWISDVKTKKNGAKVNTSVLYPSDILNEYRYKSSDWSSAQMFWDNLPEYFDRNLNKTLVVADTSGSMLSGSNIPPISVSIALAIYMGQRNTGPFKDKALTFSYKASWIDFSGKNLKETVSIFEKADWGYSTNLQSVFNLILDTAIRYNVPQSDMPNSLVIVSDMEFNSCGDTTNLNLVIDKYKQAGYELPKITFWNVNGRQGNVPARAKDHNIAMISGYSPSVMKAVLSATSFTPISTVIDTVMVDRYNY